MTMRLPKKKGFRSLKTAATEIYTGDLDALGSKINNETLAENGLIADSHVTVKLIAKGGISKKHSVELDSASTGAIALIEKAGGSFTVATAPKRQKKAKKATDDNDK
jgi:ribosomal protein L15